MAKRRKPTRSTERAPAARRGQPSPKLDRQAFANRLRARFSDPTFEAATDALDRVIAIAWRNYRDYRKSPRKHKAGPGFADPDYELADDWRAPHDRIAEAAAVQRNPRSKNRVLLICAASRNDKTCPGEMSKTFRLTELARARLEGGGCKVDFLDLSHLASEYGRVIYPCKACVSTAMPLCHWP